MFHPASLYFCANVALLFYLPKKSWKKRVINMWKINDLMTAQGKKEKRFRLP